MLWFATVMKVAAVYIYLIVLTRLVVHASGKILHCKWYVLFMYCLISAQPSNPVQWSARKTYCQKAVLEKNVLIAEIGEIAICYQRRMWWAWQTMGRAAKLSPSSIQRMTLDHLALGLTPRFDVLQLLLVERLCCLDATLIWCRQGDGYDFHYTLPSQSQHLEESLRSRLFQ